MKTLKDIERDLNGRPIYFKDEERQLAIKWIKDEDMLSPSAKAGFKLFFNLTEEDLK